MRRAMLPTYRWRAREIRLLGLLAQEPSCFGLARQHHDFKWFWNGIGCQPDAVFDNHSAWHTLRQAPSTPHKSLRRPKIHRGAQPPLIELLKLVPGFVNRLNLTALGLFQFNHPVRRKTYRICRRYFETLTTR